MISMAEPLDGVPREYLLRKPSIFTMRGTLTGVPPNTHMSILEVALKGLGVTIMPNRLGFRGRLISAFVFLTFKRLR